MKKIRQFLRPASSLTLVILTCSMFSIPAILSAAGYPPPPGDYKPEFSPAEVKVITTEPQVFRPIEVKSESETSISQAQDTSTSGDQ